MAGAPIRRARRAAKAAEEERRRLAALRPKAKAQAPIISDWVDDPTPLPTEPLAALEAIVEVHHEAEILPSGRVLMEDGTILEQEQFSVLVKLSFENAKQILEIPFNPAEDPKAYQLLARKNAIITSVMTTLARIDEARLRGMRQSKIEKVIQAIRDARAAMA